MSCRYIIMRCCVFAFACTVDVHVCLHLSVVPMAHLLQRQSHAQPRSTRVSACARGPHRAWPILLIQHVFKHAPVVEKGYQKSCVRQAELASTRGHGEEPGLCFNR